VAIPLNPAQQRAVEHSTGPLLVLAGAGSGKTRVITQRIARLISRGVPAKAIVALTFTNKAAREMAERVDAIAKESGLKKSTEGLFVSTFHSFGLSVLSRERKAVGGTFTIFDQGDQLALVKELLSRIETGRAYDASAIMARISNAKNAFILPEDLVEREGDEYDEITKEIYPRYQAALRNFHAFDFDDLVCEVARMLKTRDDILERWQTKFRYILVDEYQDTNGAQLAMLRLLADKHRNICVVGDDDQAIYAWRGADVKNILEFEEHFPGAEVVKLEQNYRSRAPILAVANSVIEKRTDTRHRKILFTDRAGGEKVQVGIANTPEAEASFVAQSIAKSMREEGRKARDVAVLYRSNGQAKALEESLREAGVPYRVVGGQQFFERKEVKDLLSYLKLALNRSDEISLRRIINYPPRGIGETSLERLSTHAMAKGWSLWQTVERVDALDDIPQAAREGCKHLERVIGETRKKLLVERSRASYAARDLSERVGFFRDIDMSSPSPQIAARRKGNLEALFSTFSKREAREQAKGNDATNEQALAAFLHALTLNFDEESEEATDKVTLSTLHGSKGLEFDLVYLVGCEEGLLPHSRTLDSKVTEVEPQHIEEERRLFYVGVTRAKERLVLLRSRARMMRGKPVPRTPSRFVLEIPTELVDEIEVRGEAAVSQEAAAVRGAELLAMLDAMGKP